MKPEPLCYDNGGETVDRYTPGEHLGKKIKWADLPDNVRRHAEARIRE